MTSHQNWSLSREAFDRFLERLDPDRDRAGVRYEQLRRGLITLFESRGLACPEDHADETLNRVSRRLEEGETISEIYGYVGGVARLVSKEARRAVLRHVPLRSDPPQPDELTWRLESEARLDCLRKCVNQLPAQTRLLLQEYCRGEWQERVARRQEMAKRLGVTSLALRLRVHRFRDGLSRCAAECLRRKADL